MAVTLSPRVLRRRPVDDAVRERVYSVQNEAADEDRGTDNALPDSTYHTSRDDNVLHGGCSGPRCREDGGRKRYEGEL